MDSIVFGPDLALGIPVLDQSHRVIFDLLESMAAMPRPAFDQACRTLAVEIMEDLREENNLMERIGYPAAEAHRCAHGKLLASVAHILPLLRDGKEAAARQIVRSLPDWIEAHINTMDLALAVAVSRVA
ncbi:bacteriohemerythrin [Pseudoduganella violaceinigra]|uniref:bacteriohemerythrin n=1 Tax=Pseudoduganella violaceinigra TaxID=246602 RepID=UPI00041F7A4B|nr:hemerythrin family protein [Pseudoduganella violaceinigra]